MSEVLVAQDVGVGPRTTLACVITPPETSFRALNKHRNPSRPIRETDYAASQHFSAVLLLFQHLFNL